MNAWRRTRGETGRIKGASTLAANTTFGFSLPSSPTCDTLGFDLDDDFKVDFWSQFSGLVWSNPTAGDSVRIRAALLKANFHVLLAIAVEFGCDRLIEEWNILQADPLTDTSGAARSVNRILKNILRGYQQACT
jgi:hypothetical protein